MKIGRWFSIFVVLLSSASAFCQEAGNSGCSLASFSNTEVATLRGKVASGPHDMLLKVPNCDESVVLVYAGDNETTVPVEKLRRDQAMRLFKKYTEATYKGTAKDICLQCPKYEVEATVTGQLEIASVPEGLKRDALGFLRDASGKVVGTFGFGHPNRPYKYRLVIESVSGVTARRLPRPKPLP